MTNSKRILFISHEATRTGAPFVLLYLMQWLKQNTNYEADVLLLKGGPLAADFKDASGNCYVASDLINPFTLANRVKKSYHLKSSRLLNPV